MLYSGQYSKGKYYCSFFHLRKFYHRTELSKFLNFFLTRKGIKPNSVIVFNSLFNVPPIVCPPIVCGVSVFGPCSVKHYIVTFLVLQSPSLGKESWMLYFICLPDVLFLLVFCGSSPQYHTFACKVVFLIIFTFCHSPLNEKEVITYAYVVICYGYSTIRYNERANLCRACLVSLKCMNLNN